MATTSSLGVIDNYPTLSSGFDTVRIAVNIQHLPLEDISKKNPLMHRVGRNYYVQSAHAGVTARLYARNESELLIEASIPKFLTGQNVHSSEDMLGSCAAMVLAVLERAKIPLTAKHRRAIGAGNFTLKRVDFFAHSDCGSPQHVPAVMRALMRLMMPKHETFSRYRDETFYWGQHSKRRTLVVYNKGAEVRARGMPVTVYRQAKMLRLADRLVRVELRLHPLELARRGLETPTNWNADTARELMKPWLKRLSPIDGRVPTLAKACGLSLALEHKLQLFLAGYIGVFDRTPSMVAENRRDILAATGIDVKNPCSLATQARSFKTVRSIFKQGLGFHSSGKLWERLLEGDFDNTQAD